MKLWSPALASTMIGLSLSLFACAPGGGESGPYTGRTGRPGADTTTGNTPKNGPGQVRSVNGRIIGVAGKVAVGALTQTGRKVVGVLDRASGKFTVNLPKGEPAVLVIESAGTVKRVASLRNDPAKHGKTDAPAADNVCFEIPAGPFTEDADLGPVFFDQVGVGLGDDVLLLGADGNSKSIWRYVDSDGDGLSDWADQDDDGDGTVDWEDAEWASVDSWAGAHEEDDSYWDIYDDDELCAWGATGVEETICWPADEDFFTEDECEKDADASDWCTFEGEPAYYETDEEFDWDYPEETEPADTCAELCAAQCGDDASCLGACVAECESGPQPTACEAACQEECSSDSGCLESCLAGCETTEPDPLAACKQGCDSECGMDSSCLGSCYEYCDTEFDPGKDCLSECQTTCEGSPGCVGSCVPACEEGSVDCYGLCSQVCPGSTDDPCFGECWGACDTATADPCEQSCAAECGDDYSCYVSCVESSCG